MQVEAREAADGVERERAGQAEAERRGDRSGPRGQLALRCQNGDAGQLARERAQRCHRLNGGDTAARDHDVVRRRTSHGLAPLRAALRPAVVSRRVIVRGCGEPAGVPFRRDCAVPPVAALE